MSTSSGIGLGGGGILAGFGVTQRIDAKKFMPPTKDGFLGCATLIMFIAALAYVIVSEKDIYKIFVVCILFVIHYIFSNPSFDKQYLADLAEWKRKMHCHRCGNTFSISDAD